MYNTNADAIDKAFLTDLVKGVKVEPTVRYYKNLRFFEQKVAK